MCEKCFPLLGNDFKVLTKQVSMGTLAVYTGKTLVGAGVSFTASGRTLRCGGRTPVWGGTLVWGRDLGVGGRTLVWGLQWSTACVPATSPHSPEIKLQANLPSPTPLHSNLKATLPFQGCLWDFKDGFLCRSLVFLADRSAGRGGLWQPARLTASSPTSQGISFAHLRASPVRTQTLSWGCWPGEH